MEDLSVRIEKVREELNDLMKTREDVDNKALISISEKLDRLIVEVSKK